MTREKIRVLIVGGTLETGLHPVPPVADGAPEWNIFRLAEAAACNPESCLDIHIVSPCEAGQVPALKNFPVQAQGKYHHIIFQPFRLTLYRKFLRHLMPLHLFVRRLAKLPDLMSWWYLRRVLPLLPKLQPDYVIINDRPQYIRFLRSMATKGKLFLMLRHPVGESARYLSQLDGIIVNSLGMKKYVEQFVQSEKTCIWQVPNSIDDNFVIPVLNKGNGSRSGKTIVFAGRLIQEKGVHELLQAFRKIYSLFPDSRLVICGTLDSRSPYVDNLQLLAEQFPSDVVKFAGYIPHQQMSEYYRQGDVAVFPSLPDVYIESFGMVALEAMRCKLPVVASRQPGFEELITSGENGFLVNAPRDINVLADAILQILASPELALRMGLAGYQCSLEYTPEKGLRALEAIFTGSLCN